MNFIRRMIDMNVKEYVEVFTEALNLTNSKEVAIAVMQECGKDSRTPDRLPKQLPIYSQATDKQKTLLKKMKVKFPENISKTDASKLIEERLKNAKTKED